MDDNQLIVLDENERMIVNLDTLGNFHWVFPFPNEIKGELIEHQLIDSNLFFLSIGEHYNLVGLDESNQIIFQKEFKTLCKKCELNGFFKDLNDEFYLFGKIMIKETTFTNGRIEEDGTSNFLLLKVDDFGNILWQKTLGNEFFDYLNAGLQLSDGDLVFGGHINGKYFEEFPSSYSLFSKANLIKTDSDASDWEIFQPQLNSQNETQIEHNFFPNPTDEILNLIIESSGQFKLEIYTSKGFLIHKQEVIRETQINVQNFPVGLYLYKLYNQELERFEYRRISVY